MNTRDAVQGVNSALAKAAGRAGVGEVKARDSTSATMKKWWADVRAGRRPRHKPNHETPRQTQPHLVVLVPTKAAIRIVTTLDTVADCNKALDLEMIDMQRTGVIKALKERRRVLSQGLAK